MARTTAEAIKEVKKDLLEQKKLGVRVPPLAFKMADTETKDMWESGERIRDIADMLIKLADASGGTSRRPLKKSATSGSYFVLYEPSLVKGKAFLIAYTTNGSLAKTVAKRRGSQLHMFNKLPHPTIPELEGKGEVIPPYVGDMPDGKPLSKGQYAKVYDQLKDLFESTKASSGRRAATVPTPDGELDYLDDEEFQAKVRKKMAELKKRDAGKSKRAPAAVEKPSPAAARKAAANKAKVKQLKEVIKKLKGVGAVAKYIEGVKIKARLVKTHKGTPQMRQVNAALTKLKGMKSVQNYIKAVKLLNRLTGK